MNQRASWISLLNPFVQSSHVNPFFSERCQVLCDLFLHVWALEVGEPLLGGLEGASTVLVKHGPQEIRGPRDMLPIVSYTHRHVAVALIHAVLHEKEASSQVSCLQSIAHSRTRLGAWIRRESVVMAVCYAAKKEKVWKLRLPYSTQVLLSIGVPGLNEEVVDGEGGGVFTDTRAKHQCLGGADRRGTVPGLHNPIKQQQQARYNRPNQSKLSLALHLVTPAVVNLNLPPRLDLLTLNLTFIIF